MKTKLLGIIASVGILIGATMLVVVNPLDTTVKKVDRDDIRQVRDGKVVTNNGTLENVESVTFTNDSAVIVYSVTDVNIALTVIFGLLLIASTALLIVCVLESYNST